MRAQADIFKLVVFLAFVALVAVITFMYIFPLVYYAIDIAIAGLNGMLPSSAIQAIANFENSLVIPINIALIIIFAGMFFVYPVVYLTRKTRIQYELIPPMRSQTINIYSFRYTPRYNKNNSYQNIVRTNQVNQYTVRASRVKAAFSGNKKNTDKT